MLYVYHSNKMELQRQLLIEIMKSAPLDGFFSSETILVQNPGMSQWLKLSLANDFGIAANIDFPMPSAFIWNMFQKVVSGIPDISHFTKDLMKWRLMSLLPKHINDPIFHNLKEYVKDDHNGTKLYQLTDKIADLYDQYLVYRPAWIKAWETDTDCDVITTGLEWQPKLWKLLYNDIVSDGQSSFHRANLFDKFITELNQHKFDKSVLPKRIFLFGVNSLPPQYLESLRALGEHIDIHIMLTNPCRYFWGDIMDRRHLSHLKKQQRKKLALVNGKQKEIGCSHPLKDSDIELMDSSTVLDQSVGNTLLASMGKMGRDYLSLITELNPEDIDLFIDIPRDNLLHSIQSDILNLEDRFFEQDLDSNDHKSIIDKDDDSIILSGSYSKTREVEALHDYLLSQFESNPELKPLDIVVMVANIDDYAPIINAVFGNAPRDRFIPYSVSDRTAQAENPILKSYLAILGLHKERCTSSEILEILEVPAVMKKYGIDNEGLETLRGWVDESGIRWGLNKDTATTLNLPEQESNTWLFGIKRMLLGYAVKPEEGFFNNILGYEDVETSTAELAGSLSMFIEDVIATRELLSNPHTNDKWLEILNNIIETFFELDNKDEAALNVIQANIRKIFEQLTVVDYKEMVSPEIIFSHFFGGFNKDRISQNFMLGKVTFATLMPMRSIPFEVVCLLGMNDGTYPRATPPESFDLIAVNKAMKGDRSRRNDDRYLFLEAFLSAKSSFYMSYIYRSVKDNTERQPSVLVSELLDYCKKGYLIDGDYGSADDAERALISNLTRNNPLMPFSRHAFKGNIHSYASQWLPAANKVGVATIPFHREVVEEDNELRNVKELDISDLIFFWKLPAKAFFAKRLKVSFFMEENTAKDDENFSLTHLDAFKVKQTWLDEKIENTTVQNSSDEALFDRLKSKLKGEGHLPLENFGDVALEKVGETVSDIHEAIAPFLAGEKSEVEVDTEFKFKDKDIRLTGWVDNIYNNEMLTYRVGKLRTQDIMEAWIYYLSVTISTKKAPICRVVTEDGKYEFTNITVDEATKALLDLVEGYFEGLRTPLPFLPKTCGSAITAKSHENESEEEVAKAKQKMISAFAGGFNSIGDVKNEYISRVWGDLSNEDLDNIYAAAIKYLLPAKKRLILDKK